MQNTALTHKESNLLFLLDTIIHFMMMQKKYDAISNKKDPAPFYKQNFKLKSNQLLTELEPFINRDYGLVFKNGEETTNNIIIELEMFVRYIAIGKVPTFEEIQYLSKAYNQDEKLIGSISKKIIKKKDFEIVKPLGKKETDLLNLLDYSVNLVFIEKYLSKVIGTDYNTNKILGLISAILKEANVIIEANYKAVFKVKPKSDVIQFYRDFGEFMGEVKIYEKIAIAQLIEAWNRDEKSINGAVNKTLKLNQ